MELLHAFGEFVKTDRWIGNCGNQFYHEPTLTNTNLLLDNHA